MRVDELSKPPVAGIPVAGMPVGAAGRSAVRCTNGAGLAGTAGVGCTTVDDGPAVGPAAGVGVGDDDQGGGDIDAAWVCMVGIGPAGVGPGIGPAGVGPAIGPAGIVAVVGEPGREIDGMDSGLVGVELAGVEPVGKPGPTDRWMAASPVAGAGVDAVGTGLECPASGTDAPWSAMLGSETVAGSS